MRSSDHTADERRRNAWTFGLRRVFLLAALGLAVTMAGLLPRAGATDLFVSSLNSNSVLQYNGTTGAFINAFVPFSSGGLLEPEGLTFGPNGNLFVSSFGTNSVLQYNGTTGAFINVFVPSSSGGLDGPTYLTFGPSVPSVPEPATWLLLGSGMAGMMLWRKRRAKADSAA